MSEKQGLGRRMGRRASLKDLLHEHNKAALARSQEEGGASEGKGVSCVDLDSPRIVALLKKYDEDGNGEYDTEEVSKILHDLLSEVDANNDLSKQNDRMLKRQMKTHKLIVFLSCLTLTFAIGGGNSGVFLVLFNCLLYM